MDPETQLDAKVQTFCPCCEAIKKDPAILTLDGHDSHSMNIEVIDCARKNGVHIVCLPTHSTHKLQPLGVTFIIASEDIPRTGDRNLTENHPNRVVTRYQITGLVGKAYMKSATATVAANGFRKTCLFPCNRHIFHERDTGKIPAQHHQLFAGNFCAIFQNCRRTTYHERHISTDPNQHSLSLPKKNTTVIILSCDVSPVPYTFCKKQEQPTKHEQSHYALDNACNRLHGLWTPVGVRDFLFSILVQTVPGTHPASSAKNVTLFAEGNAAVAWP
jgi:hypothetical protein